MPVGDDRKVVVLDKSEKMRVLHIHLAILAAQ